MIKLNKGGPKVSKQKSASSSGSSSSGSSGSTGSTGSSGDEETHKPGQLVKVTDKQHPMVGKVGTVHEADASDGQHQVHFPGMADSIGIHGSQLAPASKAPKY